MVLFQVHYLQVHYCYYGTISGALPASLDVEPKVDFGVVNKSESVAILTIFRANYFYHQVKVIDNVQRAIEQPLDLSTCLAVWSTS